MPTTVRLVAREGIGHVSCNRTKIGIDARVVDIQMSLLLERIIGSAHRAESSSTGFALLLFVIFRNTAELGKFNLLRGSRLSVARSFSSTVVFIDPDFSVDDFAA